MTPEKVNEIFKRFRKKVPHPKTELQYQTPFELLIAVMLSAQATDKSVNNATIHLFKKADTPQAILKLGLADLKSYIKTIGLYNTKANNILKTCKILVEQHHSQVPSTREELEKLPGVGRKTANVVLNIVFNQPTIAVDTHIFRVANRIGLTHGKNPLDVENQLMKVIPKKYMKYAHHWLILHGRYTCVARKPLCPDCIIKDLCEYPNKTKESDL
jgi:endonuclease III